jgi:hypothetical protein
MNRSVELHLPNGTSLLIMENSIITVSLIPQGPSDTHALLEIYIQGWPHPFRLQHEKAKEIYHLLAHDFLKPTLSYSTPVAAH